jgi:hypothetical protein
MTISTDLPPVPEGWVRDEPPRDLRERFLGSVVQSTEYENGAAERAWSLILDAWRVIDVASARADRPANPCREEWMAALRVAIFRAEHAEATSTALDGS